MVPDLWRAKVKEEGIPMFRGKENADFRGGGSREPLEKPKIQKVRIENGAGALICGEQK